MLFRRFGLIVALIILGGVLLGGEEGIQGDRDLGAVLVIEVFTGQLGLAPLHPVEIGGNEVTTDTKLIPVLSGGIVLFLHGELAPQPVPGCGGRADQLRAPLAHPVHPFPGLIKGIHQFREAGIGLLGHSAFVLLDGKTGKLHGPAFFF